MYEKHILNIYTWFLCENWVKMQLLVQNVFCLPLQGFCLPKELLEDEAGEGATQFHDYEEGGIGDGEGKKDVSDKIESEDQASCIFLGEG